MTAPAYCLRCGAPHHGDCLRDLPTIHVYPHGTPTDSELEAARDTDHQAAVAHWIKHNTCHPADEWPIGQVTA